MSSCYMCVFDLVCECVSVLCVCVCLYVCVLCVWRITFVTVYMFGVVSVCPRVFRGVGQIRIWSSGIKPPGDLTSTKKETSIVDPQAFFELSPKEQRLAVRARHEKEVESIREKRAEMDQLSHHVPGFSAMSLGERLKVEKGLKAPLDVKAYFELIGFDVRRNELYAPHPQVGPAAALVPFGRNFFFPFAWGVCLVSQIGYMPNFATLCAGALAAISIRIAATAGVAAHLPVFEMDESKFYRITTINLVLTAALGTSAATALMALVVNPAYACVLVPACGAVTYWLPQYAPLTAAAGGILGTLTGPYISQLGWLEILPVQASIMAAAACSHYVFHQQGKNALLASVGVAALGSSAVLSGMHKMFYPFYALGGLQLIGTAVQNFHVRSGYGAGRRTRSGWFKDFPPGSQQAIFGGFVLLAMLLGRRYSHRVGLVIRDRETDSLNLDKRVTGEVTVGVLSQ